MMEQVVLLSFSRMRESSDLVDSYLVDDGV